MMNFQDLLIALSKAHGMKAAFSLLMAFVSSHILPVAHLIAVGIVLVGFDLFTGIWAALNRGEAFSSKKLKRSIPKIVLYSLAIVLVTMVEETFFGTSFIIISVSLFISLIELFSNLENISSITGINIIGVVKSVIYTRFPFLKNLMSNEQRDK